MQVKKTSQQKLGLLKHKRESSANKAEQFLKEHSTCVLQE